MINGVDYTFPAIVCGATILFHIYMLYKLDNHAYGDIHRSFFFIKKNFPNYPSKDFESEIDICRYRIKRNMLNAFIMGLGGIAAILFGSIGRILAYIVFVIYVLAIAAIISLSVKHGRGRGFKIFENQIYQFYALSQIAGLVLPIYFSLTMAKYFGIY